MNNQTDIQTNKYVILEGVVVARLCKNTKGNIYISYFSTDNEYLGTQFIKTKELDYYEKRIK